MARYVAECILGISCINEQYAVCINALWSKMLIIYLRGKAQVRQDSLAYGVWAGKTDHAHETISYVI